MLNYKTLKREQPRQLPKTLSACVAIRVPPKLQRRRSGTWSSDQPAEGGIHLCDLLRIGNEKDYQMKYEPQH
jgi:hypothetical protein